MANVDRTLPDDWHEMEAPDLVIEKYDPRPVTLFTHAGDDVGVHVLPADPIAPHAATDAYRVGFVRGSQEEFDSVDPFALAHGFEDALRVAHRFMAAYDEARSREADGVEAAVAAAERAAVGLECADAYESL